MGKRSKDMAVGGMAWHGNGFTHQTKSSSTLFESYTCTRRCDTLAKMCIEDACYDRNIKVYLFLAKTFS